MVNKSSSKDRPERSSIIDRLLKPIRRNSTRTNDEAIRAARSRYLELAEEFKKDQEAYSDPDKIFALAQEASVFSPQITRTTCNMVLRIHPDHKGAKQLLDKVGE